CAVRGDFPVRRALDLAGPLRGGAGRRRGFGVSQRLATGFLQLLTAQGELYRRSQSLGREQTLRQIVDRAELDRANGRELISVLRDHDDRRHGGPALQLPQPLETLRAGVAGTFAEGCRKEQQIEIDTRDRADTA